MKSTMQLKMAVFLVVVGLPFSAHAAQANGPSGASKDKTANAAKKQSSTQAMQQARQKVAQAAQAQVKQAMQATTPRASEKYAVSRSSGTYNTPTNGNGGGGDNNPPGGAGRYAAATLATQRHRGPRPVPGK